MPQPAAPRRIPCLLALLLVPGLALADPLSPAADGQVPQADAATLEAATPARASCRTTLEFINEQGARWAEVRGGRASRDELRAAQDAAEVDWSRRRASCLQAIIELPAGLPRDVLRHSLDLVDVMKARQLSAMRAWLSGRPTAEVNDLLADFDASVTSWTDWYRRAEDFWASALDEGTGAACLGELHRSGRRLAASLWGLCAQPPARVAEALPGERGKLERLQARRADCEGEITAPADRVEGGLLRELHGLYGAAVEALTAGDQARLRELQGREQELVSRIARCRKEIASGSPRGVCVPPES